MLSKKDAKSKHTHKHCEDALAWVRRQDKGSKITLDSSTDLEAAPGCTEQSDAATQAIDIADDDDQFSVSTPAHSNSSERLVDATPWSVDQRLSKKKPTFKKATGDEGGTEGERGRDDGAGAVLSALRRTDEAIAAIDTRLESVHGQVRAVDDKIIREQQAIASLEIEAARATVAHTHHDALPLFLQDVTDDATTECERETEIEKQAVEHLLEQEKQLDQKLREEEKALKLIDYFQELFVAFAEEVDNSEHGRETHVLFNI
ncbi:hypothetical protein IWW34DRAFT_888147 [Fusarium oxysporum f. sp. albedinis]|nr:hypothetical protein IWW34DRAFT_888147 [Fusarium oxysporum f. sp. albedinis]KAK2470327.1 hypothetical protein H9L39_17944 [Fusarium oxysporum f. sp. albedinis]